MNMKNEIRSFCRKVQKNYGGRCIPTDDQGYININVVFLNSNKQEDETQFDIVPANFDYASGKCQELCDLWDDFCKENGFKKNSVLNIYIPGIEC